MNRKLLAAFVVASLGFQLLAFFGGRIVEAVHVERSGQLTFTVGR